MGFFSQFLKSRDSFGHPISLNFNQQGDSFKTPLGGILSMFVNLFLIYYFILNFKVMVNRENDTLEKTGSNATDFGEIGEISLKKAKVMPFLIMKDSVTFQNTEKAEFTQHLWMSVKTISLDDNQQTETSNTDLRPCSLDDFDGD